MKKIKITYIIDELNIGGTENQLLKQVSLLNKDLFEQTIICLHYTSYLEELNFCCPIHVLNVGKLLSCTGFKQLLWTARLLRELKTDILQCYFIDSNIFGVLAGKIGGVRNIIACRRDMGFWYTKKLLFILKLFNIFTDRFLVNSNAVKVNLVKYEKINSKIIDIIYNGIDLDLFEKARDKEENRKNLKIPDQDLVVGIIANLNRPVKRVDLFIKAAREVLRENQSVTFLIIGDGYLKNSLEKLAKHLGISEKVYFLGLKKDIYNYLSVIDIGVLTSDSEGFSNSILEYMSVGLPVVCSETSGNEELIENGINGFLFPPNSTTKLAASILQLIEDSDLRDKIHMTNKKRINSFCWSNAIKQIENYYSNCID